MGLLDGKVAIVTGSGGGIGRCHALAGGIRPFGKIGGHAFHRGAAETRLPGAQRGACPNCFCIGHEP